MPGCLVCREGLTPFGEEGQLKPAFTINLCPEAELQVTLDQPSSLSELQFLL